MINITTGSQNERTITLELKDGIKDENSLKNTLNKILENEEYKKLYINIKSLLIIYNLIEEVRLMQNIDINDLLKLVQDFNLKLTSEDMDIHLDLENQIISIISVQSNYHINTIYIHMYKKEIKQMLQNILLENQITQQQQSEKINSYLKSTIIKKIKGLSDVLKVKQKDEN